MTALPIFLLGASGRMGTVLQSLIQQDQAFERILALEKGAVIVDFSRPDATLALLEKAIELGCPMVIGTTGFDEAGLSQIKNAAKTIPILLASNTSMGVTLMRHLVAQAAAQLGSSVDVEIIEKHHHHKVDAPSGTALTLGAAVAKARNQNFDAVKVLSHVDHGKRTPGSIGFASIRAGDIVGEHTVLFAGLGEVLEIKHTSFTREHYASGALKAAKWLDTQKPGFYSIDEAFQVSA